jgi:branched-chain amino acid transport system permease protein
MWELLAQQFVNGISAGMGYGMVALGLTLIFGVLHVINFSHGELYMLGGLCAVVFAGLAGIPYLAAVPAAAIAVAAAGWLIDRLAVRPVVDKPDGLSTVLVATYAVSLLIFHSVFFTWGASPYRIDGVPGAIEFGSLFISNQRLLVIGVGLALVVTVEIVLRHSRLGFEIRAVAQSAFAARAIGIDVARVGSLTFVIAAGLAGIAGALLAPVVLFSPLMGHHLIIKAFVVVVIGGMGSVTGAVVCGLLLGIFEALLTGVVNSGMALAFIYSLMVVMLLVRPQGLFRAGH